MDCCAPQWVDFVESHSPQIAMMDYFDKKHTVHDKVELSDFAETDDAHCEPTDVASVNKEAQQDLDIIKNTPVKMISPKRGNKMTAIQQTTYDQVFSDAIRKLDLCKKTPKIRNAMNASEQNPKLFKTPSMPIMKISKSIGCHSVPAKLNSSATASGSASLNKDVHTVKKNDETSVCTGKSSVSCSLFKEDQTCTKGNDDKSDHTIDDSENNKETGEKLNEENSKIALDYKSDKLEEEFTDNDKNNDDDKNNKEEEDHAVKKQSRVQSNRQRPVTVLTWQNGRRSLLSKNRMSNRYVSLAEAVSRFQTDTPKRFRTKSNKEEASRKSLAQSCRMRSTIPISPALMSKNRTRAATVLRPEEREKLELEEMKKHQIKANPIPPGVLRGPVRPISKTVVKKPTTAATAESTSSAAIKRSEKASVSVRSKSPGTLSHHDKTSSKNTVTKVLVTDPSGIIVEREEITFFGVPKDTGATKGVTRVMPFSFEERNKNMQMRKEQRLKNLQEANKVKTDFHAKPVPNFCKSPLPSTAKQQQQNMKKSVQPCPFSFDERNKNLSKRKEELVKHTLEDKRLRVFRANPAPVFKPIMIRGTSKERLATKEKVRAIDTRDNQENQEPNTIVSKKIIKDGKFIKKAKSIANIAVDKRNATSSKERELVAMKTALPLELNTDKRAKERREFDERMKRKEIEEEAKRQDENKKKLEQEKLLKAKLRKLAEVKARPMPMYKPLTTVKAMKPLTDPQSPAFASKLKLNKKNDA